MSQTDIRTGVDGFFTRVDSTNFLVRDLCPLYVNCTHVAVTGFSKSGEATLSVTPYFAGGTIGSLSYQPELWVNTHVLPYSFSGGGTITAVRAGFKPQFTGDTSIYFSGNSTPSHTLIVRREATTISFGSTSFNASYFKDRVLPNRLILWLQGGGGGGGGDFGAGGGGGGFLYIILDTSRTNGQFEITTGSGGAGGAGGGVFGGMTAGNAGGTSSVLWKPDSGSPLVIANAFGGGGGAAQGGAGGTGGGADFPAGLNVFYYRYYSTSTPSGDLTGETGGVGVIAGTGTNGGGFILGTTLHATHNPDDRTGINSKSTGSRSGGLGQKGGGGGASRLRSGANGGVVFGAGSSAVGGAGGGGGGNGFGAGGAGGPGTYEFYY